MKNLAAIICLLAFVAAGGALYFHRQKPALHVLFVGNSLTDTNDMPKMVAGLAAAGGTGPALVSANDTPHGMITFETHWKSGAAKAKLEDGSHWDYVIFNENSGIPSLPLSTLKEEMYPYGHKFRDYLRERGVHMVLLMTWGFKDGFGAYAGAPAVDNFDAMSDRLAQGYEGLAEELTVPVAPAGLAWKEAHDGRPSLQMYSDDHHPSPAGSYLVACVVYRTLYPGTRVTGNSFISTLPKDVATYLQGATDKVMDAYSGAYTSDL